MAPSDDETDLEGALNEALDEQLGGAAEDAEPSQERTYNRDEGGRFSKAEKEAVEAAKDAGATTQEAQAAVKAGWRPPYWKDEEHEKWDVLPEKARKAIESRERDFFRHIQERANYYKPMEAWGALAEKIKPYENDLRLQGVEPTQLVGNLIDAYVALNNDPINGLVQVAQMFGMDVIDVARQLQEQGAEVDPQIAALKKEIAELRGGLSQREQQEQLARQQAQQRQQQALQAEVAEIVKDLPHYESVKTLMGALIQNSEKSTLREAVTEAYEMACRAHPVISQRILAEQRAANVNRARGAAVSPRGAPAPNGASRTSPKMSLEEELGMLLDGGV